MVAKWWFGTIPIKDTTENYGAILCIPAAKGL